MIALFVAALAGVVASAIDYVWPSVTGSTGGDSASVRAKR